MVQGLVTGMTSVRVTERPRRIAVRAARLFDGISSTLLPDPLALIDGDRIVAAESRLRAPADAEVVDLGDATLLPGLIDTQSIWRSMPARTRWGGWPAGMTSRRCGR
jgi:dihydroorotase-like cyclic amidohydrolase